MTEEVIPQVEEPPTKQARKEKTFGPDFATYNIEGDPQSFKEAMQSRDAAIWWDAIEDEYDLIMANNT